MSINVRITRFGRLMLRFVSCKRAVYTLDDKIYPVRLEIERLVNVYFKDKYNSYEIPAYHSTIFHRDLRYPLFGPLVSTVYTLRFRVVPFHSSVILWFTA